MKAGGSPVEKCDLARQEDEKENNVRERVGRDKTPETSTKNACAKLVLLAGDWEIP